MTDRPSDGGEGTSGERHRSTDDECLICLFKFLVGEKVILLPCGHVFHDECHAEWGKSRFGCAKCQRGFVWVLGVRAEERR